MKNSLNHEEREDLVRLRRDIHQHPEMGFEEVRTAALVAKYLEELDLEVQTAVGKTGVVGLLRGSESGKVLGIRADMDALPVTEAAGREYGSQTPGIMHACGHDGHVATLLAAMSALKRQAPAGTVKAIFQPAEEGLGGAPAMIEDGVLENPKVDAALTLHYWASLPTGKIAIKAGAVMASADEFYLTVRGKGGHAAAPQETIDPLHCAAHIVTALQAVVSRQTDPILPAVVTVAEFHAGTAFNIIPGEAKLSGTVRTIDQELWEEIPGRIEKIIAGICAAFGCEYELDFRRVNHPTVNDEAMTALVREVAVDLVGEENLVEEVSMGSEDMSAMMALVPGCYVFIGCGSDEKGITAPHHHPEFDIDEDALPIGAELLVRAAHRYFA